MKNTINGFKNLYNFFWVIWKFRNFDYRYTLNIFSKSLSLLCEGIENGYEEPIGRNKKVKDIKKCLKIFENLEKEVYYLDLATQTLGGFSEKKKKKKHLSLQKKMEKSFIE